MQNLEKFWSTWTLSCKQYALDSDFEARLHSLSPEDAAALAAELGAGKGNKKRECVGALTKQFYSIKASKLPKDRKATTKARMNLLGLSREFACRAMARSAAVQGSCVKQL